MKLIRKLLVILVAFQVLSLSAGVVIAENGKSRAEIVVGNNPSAVVQFAAKELADFLGRAGHCRIPVVKTSSVPVRIYLGVTPETRAAGIDPKYGDHLISIRKDGRIFLAGVDQPGTRGATVMNLFFNVDKKGTLETVYAFLEKYLGVRWLEPGKAGELVPVRDRIELPFADENLRPAFLERRTHYYRTVCYRNAIPDLSEFCTQEEGILWGLRLRYTSFRPSVFGCHTFATLRLEKLLKDRPELFALQKDGFRSPKDFCWSNPAVEDLWFTLAEAWFRGDRTTAAAGYKVNWNPNTFFNRGEFMIDPHDYTTYYCQCPRCNELRRPFGKKGQGELVWKVIFNVARRVEKQYPGRLITTLVYPPKRFLPSDRDIPKNLRVRITIPWTAVNLGSKSYDRALGLVTHWGKAQQEKLYLWMYLRANFASALPGVPEVSVHNMQKLFQAYRPYVQGIFFEHIEPTHTIRNIDQYVLAHLLWDPDLDLDKLLKDYCQQYFGKAAQDMLTFYQRLESNWYRVAAAQPEEKLEGADHNAGLRKVYDEVYNYKELTSLTDMLVRAKAKVPAGSAEARRISRYQRFVIDLAKSNFSVFSSDKAHRFAPEQVLICKVIKDDPTEEDWQCATWQNLYSNDKAAKPDPASRFKVLENDRAIFVRAEYNEPNLADTVSRERKKGDFKDIWLENAAELFFAVQEGPPLHLVVTDRGFYAVSDDRTKVMKQDVPGITVKTTRTDKGWSFDAKISHEVSGFSLKSISDRFNITRSRALRGRKREFFTWSKDAIGRWSIPGCFTRIHRTSAKTVRSGFGGAARQPSSRPAEMLVSAGESGKLKNWYFWVERGGKAKLSYDPKTGHVGNGSRLIDYQFEPVSGKEYSASWRYMIPIPKKGSVLRVSVWARAETPSPNPSATLSVNWNDPQKRWLKNAGRLQGSTSIALQTGQWHKIALEITVPDHPKAAYLSATVSGNAVRPGKLWFDDLQIEKINP